MWWTGMSSVAPIAARFLTEGRMDTPPTRPRVGAPNFGMEDGGDVLELAVLTDDAALAVRLDRVPERLLAAAHQLVAEVFAEVDELGQVLRPAAGVRIDHDGGDRDAAERPLQLATAIEQDVLAEGGPLADLDRHVVSSVRARVRVEDSMP